MLRVCTAQARAGMVTGLAILHPRRPDTVLVEPGVELTEHAIRRLLELRVRELWIRYPGVRLVADCVDPAIMEANVKVACDIERALDAVARGAHARLDFIGYRRSIASLMERLAANPRAAVFVQEIVDASGGALAHAANTCFLSLLLGLTLGPYVARQRGRLSVAAARDASSLGVGAMLHDAGMLRLDPAVVARWEATQDERDPEFQRHVEIGHEMLREAIGPAAAVAVLHHHQRYDGTGFPRRRAPYGAGRPVAGEHIHVFARIVAAADLFDRLRHPPGTGQTVPVARVLSRMLRPPLAGRLDPVVRRALLACVPPFPPGAMVTLSTGASAVVTAWTPDDPCRPRVQVLPEDAWGSPEPVPAAEEIDLRDVPGVSIIRAEGCDVSADLFTPPRHEGAPALRAG